jgi:hypothetical protein
MTRMGSGSVRRIFLFSFLLAGLLVWYSCTKEASVAPVTNQTPKTFLWLFPENGIDTTISRQHLRWWGEDPDGLVNGFLFAFGRAGGPVSSLPSPDTLRYTWVTRNDSVLAFPLDTLFRWYYVAVRGVDNLFPGLPERSIVRQIPSPYWDKNDNGIFDSGDQALPTLESSMDPKGAILAFPVRNTPPTISFALNPNDPSLPLRQPETTFTVATFGWKGSDADGDNTLAEYSIALNDSSRSGKWLSIPLMDTVVSLVVPRARSDAAGSTVTADVYGGPFLGRRYIGQIANLRLDALNVLYLRVKDVAGEYSPTISMPSGADRWFVRKPRQRLLVISDYINSDSSIALATYSNALGRVPGGQFAAFDWLPMGRGLSANDKSVGKIGPYVPPYVDPALIHTLLLFDYVFWYTDQFPSLGVAQLSLFTYLQNGGKIVFSTTFQSSTDPRGALRDFAPIDSVSSVPFTPRPAPGDTRVSINYRLLSDSSVASRVYPQLAFNSLPPPSTFHLVFMRPIYRRTDARVIYRLQADSLNTPPRYIGTPDVAVVDGQRTIIFVGLPLHLLDNTVYGNPQGLVSFFDMAFNREFNPLQKVNRRRF